MQLPRSCGEREVLGLDLQQFVPARVDIAAVEDSFRAHMKIHLQARERTQEPPQAVVREVLIGMKTRYRHQRRRIGENWADFINYKHAVHSQEWQSIVGPEMEKFGQTNEQLFKFDGAFCDRTRLNMVFDYVCQRICEYEHGTINAKFGVFVKREEHSLKKMEENRWRIVAVPSVIDTLVHRLLFPFIYSRATENYDRTAVKIGWTFRQGGLNKLRQTFRDPISFDMSAWDWTVQPWLWAASITHLLGYGEGNPRWTKVAKNALYSAARGTFMLPSGTQVESTDYGYLKSGLYFTLYLNSIMSEIYHEVAIICTGHPGNAPKAIMGDDTMTDVSTLNELQIQQYIDNLKLYGANLKIAERDAIFCGFNLSTECPEYTVRHLWRIIHKTDEIYDEELTSYLEMYFGCKFRDDVSGRFYAFVSALYEQHFGRAPDYDRLRDAYYGC